MTAALTRFRVMAYIVGVFLLLLVFVAMPLKYFAGMPRAVSVVGMVHGVLFIIYAVAAGHAWLTARWSLSRGAGLFAAAVLPFGPFVMDARLRRDELAAARSDQATLSAPPSI